MTVQLFGIIFTIKDGRVVGMRAASGARLQRIIGHAGRLVEVWAR